MPLWKDYHLASNLQDALETLAAAQRDSGAFILDVRDTVEWNDYHIPGAMLIPLSELPNRLGELPRDRTLVVYCRGPLCVIADDALAILSEEGRKVARLEEGIAEWQQAGLALER